MMCFSPVTIDVNRGDNFFVDEIVIPRDGE
jgi:hypothetical protein